MVSLQVIGTIFGRKTPEKQQLLYIALTTSFILEVLVLSYMYIDYKIVRYILHIK